ncbi:hypothetical protein [Xanthomarina spongicola]|uniref:Uncharacterized protein n=1 Tax=Xanthomarina spongicola TaxID=570520 RepID=A0A316DPU1_9FLAO|nr:hypothetical protein [Xanthomarina spongicola]PWK19602.1 hypothetical protein LX78_00950 [Xanthomarina spongicola]
MKELKILLLHLIIASSILSCRTEESELIETPTEDTIKTNSLIANLMKRTTSNDGSVDNIIDYANCFTVKLPISVTANGVQLTIYTANDYDDIEFIFDEFDDDNDTIIISYPITIILEDYSEVSISNSTELLSYSSNCHGENVLDDDIECLDFIYPISASVFNINNELIDTIYLNNDNELYHFIDQIDLNDIVTLNFPISVVLYDDSQLTLNSLIELETTIINFTNTCDEDDDYDYNDDDCDNCTPVELESFLTSCSNWTVDKLERSGNDYDDLYDNYFFNFYNDGSIVVDYPGGTDYGTWITSGTGNNIEVVINIPDLPYCNNNWILHEIEERTGETKIDLRVGGDDRLRYESTCN